MTALAPFVPNLPAQLSAWAARDPDRPCIAERAGKGGPWVEHSFGQFKHAADAVTQWLLDRGVPPGRSLLILSGNSVAHAVVKFGGMASGVPVCPVSANYSLMPGDFGRLRHVVNLVQAGRRVRRADRAVQARARDCRLRRCDRGDGRPLRTLPRPAIAYADVLATTVTPASRRRLQPSTPTRIRSTC